MSVFDYQRSRESYIEEKLRSRSSKDAFISAYKALDEFSKNKCKNRSLEQILEQIKTSKSKERDLWTWLQNFVNHLQTRGLNAVSIRSSFKRIKPYLRYRLEIKIHAEDVKENITFPQRIKEKRHGLSLEQIKTIINYASSERKALYMTLLSGGMRIQEACHLRKRDFDTNLERWKVNLRATYTKNKVERTTFISKEASSYLQPIFNKIGEDDLVFAVSENPWRSTLTEEAYFGRLRKRVGLNMRYDTTRFNKVALHAFRAYFITKCEKISDGLGHALAGHERYMSVYERYSDKELLEFYLKAEPELVVYDSEIIAKAQQELGTKVEAQQEEIINLKQQVALFGKIFNNISDDRRWKIEKHNGEFHFVPDE